MQIVQQNVHNITQIVKRSRSFAMKDQTKSLICRRISLLVDERGISQAELARRSGLRTDQVHRVVSGKGATFDQVWALAEGLDMTPAELMGLDAGSSQSAEVQELLDAIEAGEPQRIRTALARLIPPETYDKVVGGVVMPADERAQLAQAMMEASEHFRRLAAGISKNDS